MVKGDKRNKREYERKNQKQESDQKDAKNINKSKQTNNKDDDKNPPSNFKGVKEDAAKLISEANERFLEESKKSSPGPSEDKWKKRVVSNWDRYEILSDEENEEDILTGQSWDLALGSGSSANSHIKLKGEEGWTTSGDAELSKEFFSLDLGILDNLIKCIPLHNQIDLQQELVDDETLQVFENKAAENRRLIGLSSNDDVNDISKKMMSLLTDHKSDVEKTTNVVKATSNSKDVQKDRSKDVPKSKSKDEEKNKIAESRLEDATTIKPCEDKSGDKDEIIKTANKTLDAASIVAQSAPQQQRQRRNRNKKDTSTESTALLESPKVFTAVSESQNGSTVFSESDSTPNKSGTEFSSEGTNPLETDDNDISRSLLKAKNKIENDQEKEDLQFLESLDKTEDDVKEVIEKEEISAEENKKVVSVSIIDEGEKKGLEDWLDDFLAD